MRCQIWLVNPMDVILWTHRALLSAAMLYGKFISYKMFSVAWSRISSKLLFLRFLPQGDISFPLSFRVHLNEAKYHRSPFRARATILYSTFYELVRFLPLFFQASDQKQTEVGSHRSGMWEAWQWSQKKLCWRCDKTTCVISSWLLDLLGCSPVSSTVSVSSTWLWCFDVCFVCS